MLAFPLALSYTAKDIKVVGFDVSPERVANLQNGQSPLKHIPADAIQDAREKSLLDVTEDFSQVQIAMLLFSVFLHLLTRTENRMSASSRPPAGPLDLIFEKGISYPSNRPPTQVQPRRLFNLFWKNCLDYVLATNSASFTVLNVKTQATKTLERVPFQKSWEA